jgi:diacylglycerol kinase family enzyme
MSAEANISPHSTLNDGFIQLSYLRKNGPNGGGSRKKLLDYLLGLAEGSHVHNESIEMVPVRAYRIEPIHMNPNSKIAVDGELIPMQPIQVEILRGLVKVFAPAT